jgi:hypothetical protein
MKEATKIVVNGEQGLNLAAKAFLLIDRRFHAFGIRLATHGASLRFSLRSFANAIRRITYAQ